MNEELDIAQESLKTRRAREKIKKQIDETDRKITPQALQRKIMEIQNWITRHSTKRVILKEKISLFDENQNAAEESQKVRIVAQQLKDQLRS